MATPVRAIVATALAMSALGSLPRLPGIAPAGAAAVSTLGASGGQTNADPRQIRAEGEKIAVPGADGCFIYVTAWENGSWVDHSARGGPRLQQGKTSNTDAAKRDVEEMKRWLETLLAQSEDMRDKVKAACEASDDKLIQVAIVRDDPETGPGTAFVGTPLIVLDVGDTEKLGVGARTSSETPNAALEASSRQIVTAYLPVAIIVHEIDHMRRKNEPWGPQSMEYMAMDDEDRVAVQLETFKPHRTEDGIFVRKLERLSYTPLVYKHRPFRDREIYIRFDPAGAGFAFERRQGGGQPRFGDLSDDDDRVLDDVPSSQQADQHDGDLDGIGNPHDNCPHAWNPRQQDGNGDGIGDYCDPGITEGHRVTDALVASAVDAVKQAASLAGGAPHLALIGPDGTGVVRFVRLAEVWPFADPFGIFRLPGIGDRMLDASLRAAISLRLTLHLFSNPFGILWAAGIGPLSHDMYGSNPTVPKVQAFAGRIGTFLPGAAFGGAIVIPVWVDPPPLAAGWRRLPAATAAGQPLTPAAVHARGLNGRAASAPAEGWLPSRADQRAAALGTEGAPRQTGTAARRAAGPPAEGWLPSRADQRAAARGAEGAPRQTSSPPRPSVKLFFVSTGQTTGPAFRMTAVNDGNVPVWLMLNTFALKPLANVTVADVERQLKPFAGRGRVTVDVDGYCLDFPKEPPPAGMVFGLADDTLQAQMDPIDRIAHTVVRLRERGRLEPDTDDPMEYAHDMVQWSIWTHREGFDESRFTKAFIEHVRKNFAAAGDKWTREMERAVTDLAPQRWTQIQLILHEAERIPRRTSSSPSSGRP